MSRHTVRAHHAFLACLIIALSSAPAASGGPRSESSRHAGRDVRPSRVDVIDDGTRLDVNNVSMVVTNTGSFAWDRAAAGSPAGFEFPKGSGKTAVYAAGLWLGAMVGSEIRVALSEYEDEYAPGAVIGSGPGATPDDPGKTEYKVYKLNREYGDIWERDAALADYRAGAVPHGAPPISVLPDGSLSIAGDQMTWSVFNDLDASRHFATGGQTLPLGVEVQQTCFAFNAPGALGNTVFVQYRIFDRGANALDAMYLSLWCDPDVGGFTDDLVGADVSRSVGFAYNATNSDAVYGANPPSVGVDLLRGPEVNGNPLPLSSFIKYINGTDPPSAAETYHYMQGLNADGSPIIDPTTSSPTTFMVPGDPVTATGWIDSGPADRRMMLTTGPFSMNPGETREALFAIVVGQASDRLSSISLMRYLDDQVQAFYDATASVNPPTVALAAPILTATPVPSAGSITIDYALQQDGPARLSVFDTQGREVAVLADAFVTGGVHRAVWNGRTAAGVAPPGVYFVRCRAAGAIASRRVVVAR